MPSSSCYSTRFGSLVRAYTLIGWEPDKDFSYVEINRSIRRARPRSPAGAPAQRDAQCPQRRAQAHPRCFKRPRKTAPLTAQNQRPDLTDPAVPKGGGLKNIRKIRHQIPLAPVQKYFQTAPLPGSRHSVTPGVWPRGPRPGSKMAVALRAHSSRPSLLAISSTIFVNN